MAYTVEHYFTLQKQMDRHPLNYSGHSLKCFHSWSVEISWN